MCKTKIVCTIGPTCDTEGMLVKLMDAGMDVARLNMSHGDHESHGRVIELIKKLRKEKHKPVAIMLDTKGPEIRTGTFVNKSVTLVDGQKFTLCSEDVPGDETRVSVTYKDLYKDVEKGSPILIDDGLVELRVTEIKGGDIACVVENGGAISDHKGINVPHCKIGLPALTERDVADVTFGVQAGIDLIAASFTRKPEDVLELRKLLEDLGADDVQIYSKIENEEGVKNVEEIIRIADGLMVARGDLGVEVPIEEVPQLQKEMINICNRQGKPVITATQMLDSMMRNPRPTRAEVSDVANSILDGTDAIMLSGETASGKYPIEAVGMMKRIAECVETRRKHVNKTLLDSLDSNYSITNAVSFACTTIATDVNAAAIITPTHRGSTARKVSKYRPLCQLIATTTSERVYNQLACVWGVIPMQVEHSESTDKMMQLSIKTAVDAGYLHVGDVAVITAGVPVGMSGTTNLIHVSVVGDVLLRGKGVGKESVIGRACVAHSVHEAAERFKQGDILIVNSTTNEYVPYLRRASGIVVESEGSTSHAVVAALALDIPVIHSAESATSILRTGMLITLDPKSGYVYNGQTKVV